MINIFNVEMVIVSKLAFVRDDIYVLLTILQANRFHSKSSAQKIHRGFKISVCLILNTLREKRLNARLAEHFVAFSKRLLQIQ